MGADGPVPRAGQAGRAPRTSAETSAGTDLAAVDAAIAALQAQRAVLGETVVETALAPLRERRALLEARAAGEQRKLVTVLFADLVDFTGLGQRLDPEDVRRVVNAVFARWRAAVEAEGGTVEKFAGDAVMAVFGLRRAFEDDAERAVRAALAMRAGLPAAAAELGPPADPGPGSRARPTTAGERADAVPALHLRVGIDTGDVVVGAFGERGLDDLVAVGTTVNRAARLQSAAPVDGILVALPTHRQTRGRFAVEPRPGLVLKGLEAPVDAYLVLSERPRAFTLERVGGVEGVVAGTVGREAELRALQDALDDVVAEGRWRVVTIVGEAGVGKTRLLRDLDQWLGERTEDVWWFRGRAWASGSRQAGALLRDLLATRFGVQDSDPPDVVRDRVLAGFAAVLGPGDADRTAQVVGRWVGLSDADRPGAAPAAGGADARVLRDEATTLLATYFARLAEAAPVVVLLEDLHWADDVSLRWLDAAAPVLARSRVLVVATARPALLEERPRWGEGLEHHDRLDLRPLGRAATRRLVRTLLAAADDVPAALEDLLCDAAEGNPFYVEELVAWLLDAGVVDRSVVPWRVRDDRVPGLALPDSLRSVLQARLDALPADERAVLQRAAVVGRVFWDAAVRALADPRDPDPASGLDDLRRRDLVLERETSTFEDARELLFRHALLRDAAYEGVLHEHRRRYHHLAAGWLAAVASAVGRADQHAAAIAEHLDRAGSPEAASWYVRAARRAASVYANTEALALLDRVVELLDDGPVTTDDHTADELRFDAVLAREDVLERLGDREREASDVATLAALADTLADPGRRVAGLLARARWAFLHSRYDETIALADAAADVAGDVGLGSQQASAHLWAGRALTWGGDGAGARERLTRALGLATDAGRPTTVAEALRYLAIGASNDGEYARALELGERSRRTFEEAGDSEGAVMAMSVMATTYFNMNRTDEARRTLEDVLGVFERTGHRYRQGVTLSNLSVIAAGQGAYAEAERRGLAALDILRDVDDLEAGAIALIALASVDVQLGRWDDAERRLVEARDTCAEVDALPPLSDACFRLSWVARRRGDAASAAEHAAAALRATEAAPTSLEHANALLATGLAAGLVAHRATGRADDAPMDDEPMDDAPTDEARADDALARAAREFEVLGLPARVRECVAARATVRAASDLPAAVRLVEPLLDALDVEGLEGTEEPELVLAACVDVLARAGDPRADDARRAAESFVLARAAAVGDDALAEAYLADPVRAALARR